MSDKEPKSDMQIDPVYAGIKEEVSKTIHTLMRKHRIRGASIALIDDQRTVWAQGFGYADVKKKKPAMAGTVYRVGSISKLFTDTAVMQLAERGKMDIDKPLATYIPDFTIRSRFAHSAPITPRNIMTHHSGLPENYLKGMWGDPQASFSQLPELIRNEYVAYPPNMIFAYSNLGLSLLGLAVQNVSGESFVSYMDRYLLQPMGMNHSSFELTPAIHPLMSQGYDKGKPFKQLFLRDLPAGSLYSTVEDMARFAKMTFANGHSNDQQIIQAGTLAEMLRPQNQGIPLDVGLHIGLGWFLTGQDDYRGSGPVVWHTGGTPRFYSILKLMPEHKLGVVVLTNSKKGALLIDKVATQTLRLALEKKTGVAQTMKDPTPKRANTRFSPEMIQSLPGYYATMLGLVMVKARGGGLYAVLGKRKLRIEHYEDETLGLHFRLFGIFKISGPLKAISFSVRHIGDHEVLVAHMAGVSSVFGEKIALPATDQAWRKRLGSYEVVNPDEANAIDQVRLQEQHDALLIQVRLKEFSKKAFVRALLPLSDTEAIIAGLGRGQRETIHVIVREGTEYLYYSGFEFKKDCMVFEDVKHR